jgi:hypothetical protein
MDFIQKIEVQAAYLIESLETLGLLYLIIVRVKFNLVKKDEKMNGKFGN